MLKAIIFDFGDIFINLDKSGAMNRALELFNIEGIDSDMISINASYEKGEITTEQFKEYYRKRFSLIDEADLIDTWNCIIKDFPKYRLDFLRDLRQETDLSFMLLSNTNELHIQYVKDRVPFFNEFKNHFNQFYLSHEIQRRKPESEIYNWVLEQNDLKASECLFIDDTTENTEAAKSLGFQTWNLDPSCQDIIELKERIIF
ncbi:MAG: HAD family phosphatase [Bacteroidia bacterium]|nr:HAD family phosphatase [Bacteroidia bacterium]NNF81155.1 HAD family phosphatase [Flavobacteriaceae bacterium]NNK71186.1 HAD family phosphatase [Flavobacteriaceae bacterium]NNL81007.1 HAD family phosphatase [Flavobacteriaceae bacterium]